MEITLADASVVNCDTVGKVDLMLDSEIGDPVWIRLNDVLFIEEMCMNLISPAVLDDHGISTIFGNGTCKMVHIKSNELIGTASKDNSGGLYKVHGHVKRNLGKVSANIASGLELWHKRLGHLPYRAVKSMAKHTKGINLEDKPEKIDCTDCVEGKSKNGSHKGSLTKSSNEKGSVVYTDVCGPFPTRTWGEGKYLTTFTEAKYRYLHVKILQKKFQVAQEIKKM